MGKDIFAKFLGRASGGINTVTIGCDTAEEAWRQIVSLAASWLTDVVARNSRGQLIAIEELKKLAERKAIGGV